MASLTSTLTHTDSPLILGVKGAVVGSTLFLAGALSTVSLQFLPGLVLAAQQKDGKSGSSNETEGRLTPTTSAERENKVNLTPLAALKGSTNVPTTQGYKVAALQFVLMSKTAFATQVPPELLTIIASGFLAYHYRAAKLPLAIWGKWAAVSGLVLAIFPLTGGLMVPIDHKIARIAGAEAQVEPFEDAPPDRDAERTNTEAFLKQWGALNGVRSLIMTVAGGIGLWGLLS